MKVLALLLLCVAAANAAFKAGYVIGGQEADFSQWAFTVSLQSFGSHFCGAVIYDETHIVTAAHCVVGSNPSSIRVMAGSNNVDSPSDTVQYYDLSAITTHEDYGQGRGIQNDVAVLLVDGVIEFQDGVIEPIALASDNDQKFDESFCEIGGWGRTDSDNSPALLQFAEVNVIPEAECQDDWDWTSDSHICIRDNSGNAGACFGDSGGPMTCVDADGNRVLAGVTSGGDGGCDVTVAAFYTRISFFYDWIIDNLQ